MALKRAPLLVSAGLGSAGISALHLGIIVAGPSAYRYFGAGEALARQAEAGLNLPSMLTFAIALIFAGFAVYAFAGAGVIARLPLQRTALAGIAAVYLLRGLSAVPQGYALILAPNSIPVRYFVFSFVSLVVGICYACGTYQSWAQLSAPKQKAA